MLDVINFSQIQSFNHLASHKLPKSFFRKENATTHHSELSYTYISFNAQCEAYIHSSFSQSRSFSLFSLVYADSIKALIQIKSNLAYFECFVLEKLSCWLRLFFSLARCRCLNLLNKRFEDYCRNRNPIII